MDYEKARANMIEQQIRPWNVLAMQTLNALGEIRREDFVPAEHRELAFMDVQIPLGEGEFMLEPKLGARMMEALGLGENDHVLEIGTGSGYVTALMASVCREVTSIEIHQQLHEQARRNLSMAGIDNVTLVNDDAQEFCHNKAFDAVLITGSMPAISSAFLGTIGNNGRLVGIEGHDPAMQVVRYTKTPELNRQTLWETSVGRLRNLDEKPQFQF